VSLKNNLYFQSGHVSSPQALEVKKGQYWGKRCKLFPNCSTHCRSALLYW